jgi:peptidoglycan LD-endopeptidase CwlK
MAAFGAPSAKRLATCHPDLQKVMNEAIKGFDFMVLCGYRGEAEQNIAFTTGKSKLRYPNSKHNKVPSLAVDIVPFPIDWDDINRFKELARHINSVSERLGIKIRHGADWNSNGRYDDEKFVDWPHWELLDEKKPVG